MDQLHEELKELVEELEDQSQAAEADEDEATSEPAEPKDACEANEADTLISDEEKASRERQREKNLINELHRADLDKDEDMVAIVSSQGAVKHAYGKVAGQCLDLIGQKTQDLHKYSFLCLVTHVFFFLDTNSEIQISSSGRPQSPSTSDNVGSKLSSSPPKSTPMWPNINPAHKKGNSGTKNK